MIISGGENVYSAEVEAVAATHPAVQDVAIIGMADDRWGERVHAVAVVKPDHELDADELRAFCRERLADYKCPRSLEIVDTLPKSGAGKVLKHKLRRRAVRSLHCQGQTPHHALAHLYSVRYGKSRFMPQGCERFSLRGCHALVTGASRGIGRAIAIGMAEAGAAVTLCARSMPALEEVANEVQRTGGRALPVQCDVTQRGGSRCLCGACAGSVGGRGRAGQLCGWPSLSGPHFGRARRGLGTHPRSQLDQCVAP